MIWKIDGASFLNAGEMEWRTQAMKWRLLICELGAYMLTSLRAVTHGRENIE